MRPRLVPAVLLCALAAVVSIGLLALGEQMRRRTSGTGDTRLRDAQERFLAAFPVLMAARDQLPLPAGQRDELARTDALRTGFVGLEFTGTTTTDGSLDAKRLSTDPQWVSRIAAMLRRCRAAAPAVSDAVWIGASGSFPALNIAAIMACEAEGLRPVVIASLAASTYGANVPGFDYLRMEELVREAGLIRTRTVAASVGGERDRGVGLDPVEVAHLRGRIVTAGAALIDAADLDASARERLRLYREASGTDHPLCFINAGGGQVNIGPESEASRLAPGLNRASLDLTGEPRGLAARLLADGVPVIHLLHLGPLNQQLAAAAVAADPVTRRLALARRLLAGLGLAFAAWWTAVRLGPPAMGPLPDLTLKGSTP